MSYCTTFNALVIVVVIYMLTLVWCFDCFLAPAQHWDQGARLACNGLRTERFIISQLRGRRRRRRRTRRRRRMKGKGKFCAFCPIFGQWKFASFALTSQNGLWLAINVTLKVCKFGLLIWDEGIKDFKQDSSWENPASIGSIWRATLGRGAEC